MHEQHDGQIAAPSVTQDSTSQNPSHLLHVHFGPAPLSTWDGTELEWVLCCGNCRRACRERGPSFGKVFELKGKWDLVWKMDKNSVGHQEGHGDVPAQPWTADEFCSVPLCTARGCPSRGTSLYLHTYFWQHRQKYTHPFAEELEEQLPSRGNFCKG